MITYMLPSAFNGLGILWNAFRYLLATRKCNDIDCLGSLLWVVVAPFTFFSSFPQHANKCGFIIVGPCHSGLVFDTLGLASIIHQGGHVKDMCIDLGYGVSYVLATLDHHLLGDNQSQG
jgi:hypothetical protein